MKRCFETRISEKKMFVNTIFLSGIDQGKRITGREMMEYAIDILADIQHRIGGGVVYLDAEDRPKLRAFYETEANFKLFGERLSETDGIQYLQYMRLL